SSSEKAPDSMKNMREQPNRTSTHTNLHGPLHLINPGDAKQLEKTYKSFTFTTKIEGITLTEPPQTTIHTFTDSNTQDALEWCKEIRFLASTNGWNEENCKAVLNLLISDEYKLKIGDKRTFDTKLDALCRIAYGPEEFETLRNLLIQAKRETFINHEMYFSFLEKVKIRADMCLSHKANGDRIPERDIINIIVRNLTIREKEMLMNAQAMSLNEIKK
ncbi:hypothetical protein NGRA_3574, partial [Nosema granulosis]